MAMMQESSLGQALAEAEPPKGGISDALKKDRYELQCKLLAFVRRSADYDLVGTSVMFGLPRQVLTKLRQCSDQELQRLAMNSPQNLKLGLAEGMISAVLEGREPDPVDRLRAAAKVLCHGEERAG